MKRVDYTEGLSTLKHCMSKKCISVLLAGLCLISGAAQAQNAIVAANNQVSVSLGTHDINYREEDKSGVSGGSVLDSEKGSQGSSLVTVTRQGQIGRFKDVYFSAELLTAAGTTAYDGFLQGGAALIPYKSTTNSNVSNITLRVGQAFTWGPLTQVTPFVGIGTRTWVRDSSSDPYGYKETYQNKFYELGVLSQYAFDEKLVGSVSLSLGSTVDASMDAVMGGTGTFKLGASTLTNFRLGLDYAISTDWHLNALYTQSGFKYGESAANNGFLEPTSSTSIRGFYVGAGVHF